ncbi:hypothetical protein [Streptococcus sp. sy010]|uniref:DUF7657 domain-containing protein n=1 Tax=Streptococcus sp. sy010 TaxID=2600148 RepID=UPI0011B8462C|nr:hypothetical protein [Streptococcus sp. sy010]TWT16609.1 hypothetical protein FRX51_01485 [Streptococcus sp. sy010]
MKTYLKASLDGLIKWRYYIAVFAFLLGVMFNLHGSSISVWNKFGLQEASNGQKIETTTISDLKGWEKANLWLPQFNSEDGVILGVPRLIRSDEWFVQTSFYLSQANTGNQLINDRYALSGQNMIVAYNAPVWHPSVIGKPFNWGFLFLGSSRGLAWYWSFKLIALLLLAFEFAMILTRKNKYLSLLGSLWLTFTPTIQWWFMQHLGDIVFFTLLIMVSMYHYFEVKSKKKKVFLSACLGSGIIGYVLVIYPAFQVPFAYLLLGFSVWCFRAAYKKQMIKRFDWLMIAITLVWSLGIVGLSLYQSRDAIQASLATVYPGSRISTGGEINLSQLVEMLLNVFLPFNIPSFSNQVELASSYHFLPFILLLLPFYLKSSKKFWQIKENRLGFFLIVLASFLLFYALIGLPEILAKLSLFSYVTSSRAWQAMAVISVWVSIWFMSYIWEQKNQVNSLWAGLLLGVCSALSYFLLLGNKLYQDYVDSILLSLAWFWFIFIFFLICFGYRKLASLALMCLIILSGMTVNPLVQGTAVIEEKALSIQVRKLVNRDPNGLWLSENGNFYNYLQIFGAKSIDGVRFYPDRQLMTKLDEQNLYETEWNRYSHLRYLLTTEATIFSNPAPDNVTISLNMTTLNNLGIDYILTNRNLTDLFGQSFQEIYQDSDGNRIYRYQPNL